MEPVMKYLIVTIIIQGLTNALQPSGNASELHQMEKRGVVVQTFLSLYCGENNNVKYSEEAPMNSPWMVLLVKKSDKGGDQKVKCGATLLGGRHAITSADCLKRENTKNLQAIFGVENRKVITKDALRRNIDKVLLLPSNTRIAMLQFSIVIFSDTIRPICLDKKDTDGVYATMDWKWYRKQDRKNQIDRKAAFLKRQRLCEEDEFNEPYLCAKVIPGEEKWELEPYEIPEGAPLMVEENNVWFIKGLLLENFDDDDEYSDENDSTWRKIINRPHFRKVNKSKSKKVAKSVRKTKNRCEGKKKNSKKCKNKNNRKCKDGFGNRVPCGSKYDEYAPYDREDSTIESGDSDTSDISRDDSEYEGNRGDQHKYLAPFYISDDPKKKKKKKKTDKFNNKVYDEIINFTQLRHKDVIELDEIMSLGIL